MPLTNLGRNEVARYVVGEGTPFNATNAHIGVGNSNAVFSPAQTDLQGANRLRRPMKAGFPTRNNNILLFASRYVENEAAFHWREVGIFNHATAGVMLTRILIDQGVKPVNEIWDYEVQITLLHGAE